MSLESKLRSLGGLFVLVLICSCGSPPFETGPSAILSEPSTTAEFIPIDFTDTNYGDVQLHAKDTITSDGWSIQYLVKNDSTRYSDLYIRWSKDERQGLFPCGDVLLMRRYFIPKFTSENASHILLEHGCATDCFAVLALSKDPVPNGRDISFVVDQDLSKGQLVYIQERSFSSGVLEVSVVDLARNEEHAISFEGQCPLTTGYCIDSASFANDHVTVYAKFDENGHETREEHSIHFDLNTN